MMRIYAVIYVENISINKLLLKLNGFLVCTISTTSLASFSIDRAFIYEADDKHKNMNKL